MNGSLAHRGEVGEDIEILLFQPPVLLLWLTREGSSSTVYNRSVRSVKLVVLGAEVRSAFSTLRGDLMVLLRRGAQLAEIKICGHFCLLQSPFAFVLVISPASLPRD